MPSRKGEPTMADPTPTQKAEKQVLNYAKPQVGHKAVGRGECYDLSGYSAKLIWFFRLSARPVK